MCCVKIVISANLRGPPKRDNGGWRHGANRDEQEENQLSGGTKTGVPQIDTIVMATT